MLHVTDRSLYPLSWTMLIAPLFVRRYALIQSG